MAFDERAARQRCADAAGRRRSSSRSRSGRRCGVMRRRRPALVVGFGGFVTGPGGVAAWLTRRPLVIHEQNAIAGYSNRMLARLARQVLAAFPARLSRRYRGARGRQPGARGDRDAAAAGRAFRAARRARCACWSSAVVWARRGSTPWCRSPSRSAGGSTLQRAPPGRRARHRRGARRVSRGRVTADVTPFIDDMARAYADADLVICRAGALTISELAAVGVGAILVPFPAAVDDHQTVQRAVPGARRRGRADRGPRSHARSASPQRCWSCAPAAASCSRWPSARARSRGRAPPRSSRARRASNSWRPRHERPHAPHPSHPLRRHRRQRA